MGPGAQTNPVKQAKLILNGNDRFYSRDGRYFNLVQPYQHHENVPNNAGINVYSFALKTRRTSTKLERLNMSRIDTAVLDLQYADGYKALNGNSEKQVSIFAVNYNVSTHIIWYGWHCLLQLDIFSVFFSHIKLD